MPHRTFQSHERHADDQGREKEEKKKDYEANFKKGRPDGDPAEDNSCSTLPVGLRDRSQPCLLCGQGQEASG